MKPATPLPWTTDHECISANHQHISMAIGTDGASYSEQKQNAAYIAHACNAYPKLVEALRYAAQGLGKSGHHNGVSGYLTEANNLLRELGEL